MVRSWVTSTTARPRCWTRSARPRSRRVRPAASPNIGAYQVHQDAKTITFLDTPGHEAFTAMRARGAQSTDIAVIVVAADDGVKPQTREAVDHAKAAMVPILVAVNKIDKEARSPSACAREVTQLGLQPEEWGGETMFVDVSAKTSRGSTTCSSRSCCSPSRGAQGQPGHRGVGRGDRVAPRSRPRRGATCSCSAALKVGDALVAGARTGRVRAMPDYMGNAAKTAVPAEPVEVLGFDSVPEAGEFVRGDRRARSPPASAPPGSSSSSRARRGGVRRCRSRASSTSDATAR